MPIIKSAKFLLGKLERFFVYRVLSLDDTPHRIALGVAIGMFVTWTPTIGFQMALTVALCVLLRANKLVGVPFVWISNPLTIVPIYVPSYYLGCWLLGRSTDGVSKIQEAVDWGTDGWSHKVSHFFSTVWSIFLELWVGSLLFAAVIGALSYVIIYYLVIFYRKHWHHKHAAGIAKMREEEAQKAREKEIAKQEKKAAKKKSKSSSNKD